MYNYIPLHTQYIDILTYSTAEIVNIINCKVWCLSFIPSVRTYSCGLLHISSLQVQNRVCNRHVLQ